MVFYCSWLTGDISSFLSLNDSEKSFSHHRGHRDHRKIFFIPSSYLCVLCGEFIVLRLHQALMDFKKPIATQTLSTYTHEKQIRRKGSTGLY